VPLHQHWDGQGLGGAAEGAAYSGPAAQVLEGRGQTEAQGRTQQALGVIGKGPLLASLEVQIAVGATPSSASLGGPRHWRGSAIIGLI
jgi:hypothetical protein